MTEYKQQKKKILEGCNLNISSHQHFAFVLNLHFFPSSSVSKEVVATIDNT